MLEEFRRLPDDHISINESFKRVQFTEILACSRSDLCSLQNNERRYTGLGDNMHRLQYLIHIVRTKLNANLGIWGSLPC